MKKHKKLKIILLAVPAFLVVFFTVYALNYYHAGDTAAAVLADGADGVTITEEADGSIVFMPDEPTAGFIFYNGAEVAGEAYAPLMCKIAQRGICCVIVPVLLHTPTFSVNAADGVIDRYPQVPEWYIGGHSLGGSTAAMYLAKHPDDFAGLILLASYSITDVSSADISVLSIYGDCDGVLNRSAMEKKAVNLPQDMTVVCIPGGCHGCFGDYGRQIGDGTPTITAEEQWEITADTIAAWIAG